MTTVQRTGAYDDVTINVQHLAEELV